MTTESRELAIYIINDAGLYRQKTGPIIANLKKKIAKGVYDPTKALKLWGYLADNGAQKYFKEFGGAGKWFDMFTPADRRAAAKELADHYMEHLRENPRRKHRKVKRNPSRIHEYIVGFDKEFLSGNLKGLTVGGQSITYPTRESAQRAYEFYSDALRNRKPISDTGTGDKFIPRNIMIVPVDSSGDPRYVTRAKSNKVKRNPTFGKKKIKRKHIQSHPSRTFTLIGRPSGPIFRLVKEYISKAGIKTVWGITANEKKQTVAREKDVVWK